LRARQARNFAALLLLSQGVPMILGGDELGRTQLGNNNAYCQDNEISWVDWTLRERNADFFRFFQRLIRFRMAHPNLRRRTFLAAEPATPLVWHGLRRDKPDFSPESRVLAMQLRGGRQDDDLYIIANAHWEPHEFEVVVLPSAPELHREDPGLRREVGL